MWGRKYVFQSLQAFVKDPRSRKGGKGKEIMHESSTGKQHSA